MRRPQKESSNEAADFWHPTRPAYCAANRERLMTAIPLVAMSP
jgi:hypothetical protein